LCQHQDVRRVKPLTTVVVLVAVVVGSGIWWVFFRGPSSADCAPVRELLSFNKTQIDALNAKTHVPEAGSYEAATQPSAFDYQAWADGLADRAKKVTAADLAGQASDLAQTADRLVRARIDFDTQSEHTAPGAAAPPVGMAVIAFNDLFESQVKQLATTCPA
jgi:cytoskeletal protein RodZ